jgi:hypothetical protein
MIIRPLETTATVPPPVATPAVDWNDSIDGKVQSALSLHLELKSPYQMPAVLEVLAQRQRNTEDALASLHYVHFARFLPAMDFSALWVITCFDGDLEPYILDFVKALGDVFTAALPYVKDAPRLPVQDYPRDFLEFVRRRNVPITDWSAYPQLTVIDIQRRFDLG